MPEPGTSASPHRALAERRIIIMAAPNGARRGKADHARLPVTPPELAEAAAALAEAGTSVLHLHVRNAEGAHTLDPDAYRAALRAIADRTGDRLVVQVTTEAVGRYTPAEQMATVRALRPEAVSLALRELCPDEAAEAEAAGFYAWLRRERIWPQHILYSPEELRRFDRLRRQGVLGDERPFCLLVLGSYGDSRPGTVEDLARFLAAVDCGAFPWAACCFGGNEHAVMLESCTRGGHARLGFENNLWLPDGSLARDNAQLVRLFADAAAAAGRIPATAAEVREFLARDS